MRASKTRPAVRAYLLVLAILVPMLAHAREWNDATYTFKVNGEVAAYDGKTVRLKRDTGTTVDLPIAKLCEVDIAYLKATFPQGKSPELLAKGATKKGGPVHAKVELVGVAVTKVMDSLPADGIPVPSGTHLYLVVTEPELSFTGLDMEKSKIASCTDNKGTDLTEGAGTTVMEFKALADGKGGLIHLHQPKPPASKSVRLALKGELHLTSAGADQESQTIRVPLNLEVTLGP